MKAKHLFLNDNIADDDDASLIAIQIWLIVPPQTPY